MDVNKYYNNLENRVASLETEISNSNLALKNEIRAHDRVRAKNKKMLDVLIKISSPTQTTKLHWWQVEARKAISETKERE